MVNFGEYKVWLNRLQTYLAPINFFMVLYLYVTEEAMGVSWWVWAFLIIACAIALLRFDLKHVFPAAQKYTAKKNPFLVDLREDIDLIMEKLGCQKKR